jgi:hypothetical protein
MFTGFTVHDLCLQLVPMICETELTSLPSVNFKAAMIKLTSLHSFCGDAKRCLASFDNHSFAETCAARAVSRVALPPVLPDPKQMSRCYRNDRYFLSVGRTPMRKFFAATIPGLPTDDESPDKPLPKNFRQLYLLFHHIG